MFAIFCQPVGHHVPHPFQNLALGLDKLPEILVSITNCCLSDCQASGDQVKVITRVNESWIRAERDGLAWNQVLTSLGVIPVVSKSVLLQNPEHRLVRIPSVMSNIDVLVSW